MSGLRDRSIHGMAMVTAIIMLALLGVALALMARSFAAQAQRTRDASRDAQLRLLLQAGAASVMDKSQNWPADAAEQSWTVPLPQALSDSSASLSIRLNRPAHANNPAATIASVTATLDKSTSRQTLTLTRLDGRWRITDARLGE